MERLNLCVEYGVHGGMILSQGEGITHMEGSYAFSTGILYKWKVQAWFKVIKGFMFLLGKKPTFPQNLFTQQEEQDVKEYHLQELKELKKAYKV